MRRSPPSRRLFTVRSALVIQLALLAAAVGVVLLLAAHSAAAETALGGLTILGAAIKFFNDLIELRLDVRLPPFS